MKNTNSCLSHNFIFLLLLFLLMSGSACISLNAMNMNRINPLKALLTQKKYAESLAYIDAQLDRHGNQRGFSERDAFTDACLRHFKGRILEHQGQYNAAVQVYTKGIIRITDTLKRNLTLYRLPYYHLKSLSLCNLCYCHIRLGNYDRVYALTRYALRESDDAASRRLLGDLSDYRQRDSVLQAFTYVHVLCTGDQVQTCKIMEEFRNIVAEEKKDVSPILSPLHYVTKIMAAESLIEMVLAYSKMQSGDLGAFYHFQKKLENLYENPFIKTLVWGGKTIGVYKGTRSMIFGFGGYGYALLGQYEKSREFFLKGMECWPGDIIPKERFEQVGLGGLHIAYADWHLIPLGKDAAEIQHHIDRGMELLASSEDNWLDIADAHLSGIRNFMKAYGQIVSSKFHYSQGNWQKSHTDAKNALRLMDRVSPKLLIADAAYYAFLSSLKLGKPAAAYEASYKEALEKLRDYKGYEMWKVYHAGSLICESKGDMKAALDAAEKSVSMVGKFWENRFPDMMQQVTFMEDKNIPYQRIIELLLRPGSESQARIAQALEYIESVKISSLRISKGKDDSATLRIASLKEIQAHLSHDEAVLELYYGSDDLISLFISDSEVCLEKSDHTGAKKINRLADEFMESISYQRSASEGNKDYIRKGAELFSTLMGSHYNAGRFAGKKKIHIVPHRKLHYLAWNALSISDTNTGSDYLTDHYAISVLPAASAVLNREKSADHSPASHCSAFVIGSDINYYPSTVEEIRKLGCCRLHTGQHANLETVLDELRKADTLILYAHGRFDRSSPFDSYILLGGDEDGFRLTLAALDEAEVASRFVVLAGCATGTIQRHSELNLRTQEEKFSEADDLLGLYKTLFSKGAGRIVISVIQETSKHQTELFLLDMVRALDKGEDAAVVFRNAVHKLKKKYPHPYYWGAYVFVGM